jgi:hypothetical protein
MVELELVGEGRSRAETGERRSSWPNGVAEPVKVMAGCRRDMCTVVMKVGLRRAMNVSE